jgi:putative endonuclease
VKKTRQNKKLEPGFNFIKAGIALVLVIPGRERKRASPESSQGQWMFYVYLLASRKQGTLYLGVTKDLVHRTHQHREKLLPGFSSRYDIRRLVWFETYDDPVTAIEREKEIKKWRRAWKIGLIEKDNPDWRDLYPEIVR